MQQQEAGFALPTRDKLADGGRPPPAFVERSRTHPLARVLDLDPPSQALMLPGQAQAGLHCNLAAQISGAERKLFDKSAARQYSYVVHRTA